MAFIEIAKLRKSFGATTVVHDFDLAVERGEFVTFLGPSGCGKTTILRMIAGFEAASGGEIKVGGADITDLAPAKRNVGMVFQSYALFPNMTVAQNIAFGLKVAKRPQAEIDARVAEMLELIKLQPLAARFPFQLSGGQQQRVALARALAAKPQILLLDEPLSALDAKIRVSLREEIRAIQRELGITTIFVTHDQEEAMSISDRIVVLNGGHTEQIGSPSDIYNRPRSQFVASFIGTLNLLTVEIKDAARGLVAIDGQEVRVAGLDAQLAAGSRHVAALRPEAIRLEAAGAPASEGRNRLTGTIADVLFLGAVVRIKLRLGESMLSLDTFNRPQSPPPQRGDAASVSFAYDDLLLLAEG